MLDQGARLSELSYSFQLWVSKWRVCRNLKLLNKIMLAMCI